MGLPSKLCNKKIVGPNEGPPWNERDINKFADNFRNADISTFDIFSLFLVWDGASVSRLVMVLFYVLKFGLKKIWYRNQFKEKLS